MWIMLFCMNVIQILFAKVLQSIDHILELLMGVIPALP